MYMKIVMTIAAKMLTTMVTIDVVLNPVLIIIIKLGVCSEEIVVKPSVTIK